MNEVFDERAHAKLDGGVLESLGRLLRNDLTLYVYPLLDVASGWMTTVENFDVEGRLRGVYDSLVARGSIEQLDNYNPEHLRIFSRDALEKIRRGDPSWEQMVPPEVAAVIRERRVLGYVPAEKPAASRAQAA